MVTFSAYVFISKAAAKQNKLGLPHELLHSRCLVHLPDGPHEKDGQGNFFLILHF